MSAWHGQEATSMDVIRSTDKVRGSQFLVLRMPDGRYAVGIGKRGHVVVDGVQRWNDDVDAYIEALNRAAARKVQRSRR